MILVTGGSGNVGAELVSVLAEQRRAVRAVVRSQAGYPAPRGVQVVQCDLNRPDSFGEIFAGVGAMFLLGGFAAMPGLLARAYAAGVGHVVLLSSRSVIGGRPDNAVVRMHLDSEAAVRESGVPWTVLRPSGFMSNTFEWAGQLRAGDVVRAPFAGVPVAMIDPHDIAAAAAAALTGDGPRGNSHALSGPAALRPADRVEILAKVLGRPLQFQAQPDAEARAEMSRVMPAEYVDAFFRFFADGEFDDSPIVPTVEQLTGRPARTFEDWALAHADRFR